MIDHTKPFVAQHVALVLGSALLVLAALPSPAAAQGTGAVEGVVFDQSENPIPGATVSVPAEGRSATTDSSGFYRIEQLTEGQKTLRASASGFQTEDRTVQIVTEETTQANFFLEPEALDLTLSPATLDFGTVTVGDSTTMSVTLENTGGQDVEITSIQIEGPDSTDFAIVGDPTLGVLGPEQTQSVGVRFVPRTGGSKDADFIVESSAGRRLVGLSGEGASTPPTAVTQTASNVTARQATLRGLVDPGGAETTVEFEYFPTEQPNQTELISAAESPLTGSEEQSVTASVDSLTPGTDYTVRVRAENSAGTDTGADQTFSTLAVPPEATVGTPTDVRDSSVTLAGQVNPGGAETTVAFTYFPSGQPDEAQTVAAEQSPLVGTDLQDVSAAVEGLTPGTEYVFRVEAENSAGTDSSDDQTFATAPSPPTAITEAPTNVTATSAGLNGRVNPGGAETTVTFELFPSGQPDQLQTVAAEQSPLTGTADQDVTATAEGLTPGTQYTVRVVAENSAGSDTGADQAFDTGSAAPDATTQDATQVTSTSAVLNGTVRPNGRETTVTFEYVPTVQSDNVQTVPAEESPLTGTEEQTVRAPVDGLVPRTQYTVRVVAENSAGSDTGGEAFFTTEAAAPEAVTEAASNVTVTSAQFNGRVDPNNAETEVTFEYFPTDQPDQLQSVVAAESPLTGNEAQDVDATANGLTPGTEYTVRVVATNEGGTSRGDALTVVTPAPDLTVERSPEVPDRGSAVDVQVTAAEGFQPTGGQLSYRASGAQEYQTLSLSASGSSTFAGTIPGSAVTERGLEFHVRLSEGDVTATAPETNPAAQPFVVPVRVPQIDAPVELRPEQYSMISVPLDLEDPSVRSVLEDDLGAHDRANWRLLRWNPETNQYDELRASEETTTEAFAPGRAFWLVARNGGTFDVENARSVGAEPVSLTLPPGWTQMANPRSYPVAWSDVDGREAVNAPVAFDPGTTSEDPYRYNVSVLDPWSGYWVFNPTSSPVTVTIPPAEAQPSGRAGAGEAASTPGGSHPLFGAEPAYALQLETMLLPARGGTPADTLYDTHTVVGLAEGARPGVGPEDVAEPPPIGPHVRLSIAEDGTRLAGSLRPTGQRGYTWDLTVTAKRPDDAPDRHTVRVHLHRQDSPPSGFEHRLIDRATGRRISLDGGTFEVPLTDERPTRRLRLILGTEAFADQTSREIRPKQTELRAVYPNPSPGPVSVDYQLETARQVRISVYDLLGRRVRTLVSERRPAGHHTVQWGGRRNAGGHVASGMYVVRMKAGSTTSSRRVVLLR